MHEGYAFVTFNDREVARALVKQGNLPHLFNGAPHSVGYIWPNFFESGPFLEHATRQPHLTSTEYSACMAHRCALPSHSGVAANSARGWLPVPIGSLARTDMP